MNMQLEDLRPAREQIEAVLNEAKARSHQINRDDWSPAGVRDRIRELSQQIDGVECPDEAVVLDRMSLIGYHIAEETAQGRHSHALVALGDMIQGDAVALAFQRNLLRARQEVRKAEGR